MRPNKDNRPSIRSAMSLFSNPVKRTRMWSRWDAIRAVRAQQDREDAIANFRAQFTSSDRRFAVVTKFKNHFHVIGLGTVKCTKIDTLKNKLRAAGYTDVRLGGLKFSL